MNAAERLWRGLGAHDWAAASSQFQPNAVVEWPHSGATMRVEEYLATQRERAAHGGGAQAGSPTQYSTAPAMRPSWRS